jgi:hypothetical protein
VGQRHSLELNDRASLAAARAFCAGYQYVAFDAEGSDSRWFGTVTRITCLESVDPAGKVSDDLCRDYTEAALLDGSMQCSTIGASSGNIRLAPVGSTFSRSYGRVEIFHQGEWLPVSRSGITEAEARVACRDLGFDDIGDPWNVGSSDAYDGRFWVADWGGVQRCTAAERHLSECIGAYSTPRETKTTSGRKTNKDETITDTFSCAGHYGQSVGDPNCCGQEGSIEDEGSICPESQPICAGYVRGSYYGTCLSKTTRADLYLQCKGNYP